MTQASIVLLFLAGFVGIMLWIIGLITIDILRDGHRTRGNPHGTAEPGLSDGYEAQNAHRASHRL